MEHSAKADFHGGLGRKGSWRAPFVFLAEYHQILLHKRIKNRVFCLVNGVLQSWYLSKFNSASESDNDMSEPSWSGDFWESTPTSSSLFLRREGLLLFWVAQGDSKSNAFAGETTIIIFLFLHHIFSLCRNNRYQSWVFVIVVKILLILGERA